MPPQSYHIKIGDGRRVVLPSEVCKLMSLAVGDTIVVRVENNKATLSSVEQTIVRFQALLAKKYHRM